MKRCLLLLVLIAGSLQVCAQEKEAKAPLGRVISADDRVIVFGEENRSITAVLSQVSSLRNELNLILKDPEAKSSEDLFPLRNDFFITLFGRMGSPPQKRPFAIQRRKVEGSDRFRIELNLDMSKGINRQFLREKALECLLMDSCLSKDLRDDQRVKVAPWIITGMLERMAWRDGEADRGLYKALFSNNMMMDIERMVTLEDLSKLDAAERTAFRISAGAFFMSIVNQNGGSKTFLDYLATAPAYEGEQFLLFRNSFFTMGLSEEGLAKQWALQLANLTQEFVSETLTPLETEIALSEVLQGTLDSGNGEGRVYRLIAFQDILALPEEDRNLILSPMLERVSLLSFRCFPSYRDILSGYIRIIRQLAAGDEADLVELLTILEEKRAILKQVGERTRDYLDWYQIANATQLTGEFRDYQRLKKELETENPSYPGPIDYYLNAVQALFEK
ncbi:MAG: hypothetical protein ACSHYB_11760 [Roseibacillus sp.]